MGLGRSLIGHWGLAILAVVGAIGLAQWLTRDPPGQPLAAETIRRYCVECHDPAERSGGLVLSVAAVADVGAHAEVWEKVVRKLRARDMPPAEEPRPDETTYDRVASYLETSLDRAAESSPNPGQLPQLHRLTRTEYQNAIRDLLALEGLPAEMDYELLLPADNASSGFDNIADLLFVSPVILERYLEAARKVSRLAIGDPAMPVMVNIHRLPLQLPQDQAIAGLPFGTRGGLATPSYFPLDADYVFRVEMGRAAREPHELEITIDGERVAAAVVGDSASSPRRGAEQLEFRVPLSAGPHFVGVTFVQRTAALDESTVRLLRRSRGTLPAIELVTISGPFDATGPGSTPSRQRVFVCRPDAAEQEAPCAREILTKLVRNAYRRPATDTDLEQLWPFYEAGRAAGNFDTGIQRALERMLVSPQFLYRIERIPPTVRPGEAFAVAPLELASRLSFFIWSSLPDDELLDLAASARLTEDSVIEQQVRRMLADPRSAALVNNFAAQWLFLRDVDTKDSDLFLFRDYDESLRAAFVEETERFVDGVLRDDRSVLDLLAADYTFLNERLAEHYGVPHVRGSHFRRVTFPPGSPRGGLLGQGSILALTSYPTRTSPVLRGKYVLDNLLASPPPPPPPDVPALEAETPAEGGTLTMREAMARHRADPACASCHAQMDPIGFALENFDAIGRWRDTDGGSPIEAASTLPDGTVVDGVAGLKQMLLRSPERFVSAVTEKLLMYAVGRNIQYYDAPAVRAIVRASAAENYTFAALIAGIAKSAPFRLRSLPPEAPADTSDAVVEEVH